MLRYLAMLVLWMLLSMLMAGSWQRGGGIWIIMEEKWSGQRYQPQSRDYHQHLHHNTQCNEHEQHTTNNNNNNYKEVVIIQLKFSAMFYFNSVLCSLNHNSSINTIKNLRIDLEVLMAPLTPQSHCHCNNTLTIQCIAQFTLQLNT